MYIVFLLFPLIQERQFLVISESICTLDHFVLVNRLEGLSKKISNDQELIQSDPISYPQNQKGNN